jgi:hypothetical protein
VEVLLITTMAIIKMSRVYKELRAVLDLQGVYQESKVEGKECLRVMLLALEVVDWVLMEVIKYLNT